MEEHEARIKDLKFSFHMFRQSPLAIIGLALIISSVALSLMAPWIAPYNPWTISSSEEFKPPFSAGHIFGTDRFGRDIFSRVLYALRYDLTIALMVPALALVIGAFLGLIAGYSKGIAHHLIMRLTDAFFAFPLLVLAIAITAALREASLLTLIIALSIAWWPRYTRLVEAETLSIKNRLFIEASRGFGESDMYIIFHHVLPNCLSSIVVMYSMDMGYAILTGASLSFLGLGVGPGTPELGLMISEGSDFIQTAPWIIIVPGIVMFVLVIGFAFVGDGLRDALDPRLRR